jgi:hypothetical protein
VAVDTRQPPSLDTRVAAAAAVRHDPDLEKNRSRLAEAVEGVRTTPESPNNASTLPAAETAREPVRPAAKPPAAEPPRVVAEVPQPPATPAAAREIHLQVNGDNRVDVRVTERAGTVHVAVRTPDSHLAGALREDLPALSARLEQTGFRAETWQPTAAAERHPQMLETRPAETAQNGYPGGGQNGQSQQQGQESSRRPPTPAPETASESGPDAGRKDFSWLLSSFR